MIKTRIPREGMCYSGPRGAFPALVVRKHSLTGLSVESTPRWSGFPYFSHSPSTGRRALCACPAASGPARARPRGRGSCLRCPPAWFADTEGQAAPHSVYVAFIHPRVLETYSVPGAVGDAVSDSEKSWTLSQPWRSLKSSQGESRVHNE